MIILSIKPTPNSPKQFEQVLEHARRRANDNFWATLVIVHQQMITLLKKIGYRGRLSNNEQYTEQEINLFFTWFIHCMSLPMLSKNNLMNDDLSDLNWPDLNALLIDLLFQKELVIVANMSDTSAIELLSHIQTFFKQIHAFQPIQYSKSLIDIIWPNELSFIRFIFFSHQYRWNLPGFFAHYAPLTPLPTHGDLFIQTTPIRPYEHFDMSLLSIAPQEWFSPAFFMQQVFQQTPLQHALQRRDEQRLVLLLNRLMTSTSTIEEKKQILCHPLSPSTLDTAYLATFENAYHNTFSFAIFAYPQGVKYIVDCIIKLDRSYTLLRNMLSQPALNGSTPLQWISESHSSLTDFFFELAKISNLINEPGFYEQILLQRDHRGETALSVTKDPTTIQYLLRTVLIEAPERITLEVIANGLQFLMRRTHVLCHIFFPCWIKMILSSPSPIPSRAYGILHPFATLIRHHHSCQFEIKMQLAHLLPMRLLMLLIQLARTDTLIEINRHLSTHREHYQSLDPNAFAEMEQLTSISPLSNFSTNRAHLFQNDTQDPDHSNEPSFLPKSAIK